MCGIVGFLNSSNNYSDQQLCGIITKMSCALKHRGPDDKGIWVDEPYYPDTKKLFEHIYYLTLCQLNSNEFRSPNAFKVIESLQGNKK